MHYSVCEIDGKEVATAQDTAASTRTRWHHHMSHSATCSLSISVSIFVGLHPFFWDAQFYIPSFWHFTLSPSLIVSLCLNYIFAVNSKRGVLKLLIIIPWHDMVGRLDGGLTAAQVLQHTKWAELTEQRSRGSGQPQDGSIMRNGSWVGGRLWLQQRIWEVHVSLMGNQEPRGKDLFHEVRSGHIWRSLKCLTLNSAHLKFNIVQLIVLLQITPQQALKLLA